MYHQLFNEDEIKAHSKVLRKQAKKEGLGYIEDKLIEEMGELLQALIKRRRHRGEKYDGVTLLQHFAEEMAHVQLRLNQIMITLNNPLDFYYAKSFIVKIEEIRIKLKK